MKFLLLFSFNDIFLSSLNDASMYCAMLIRFIPEECHSLQKDMCAEKEDIVYGKFKIKEDNNSTAKSRLKAKIEKKRHSRVIMCYKLGETLRSPADMMHDQTGVAKLNKSDCCFVKRSNGSYSYAMVINRYYFDNPTVANGNGNDDGEEVLVFKINNRKSTKTCRSSLWAECIRCVVANPKNCPMDVDKDDNKRHCEFSTSEPLALCHTSPSCLREHCVDQEVTFQQGTLQRYTNEQCILRAFSRL